jgi:hypothetical protein
MNYNKSSPSWHQDVLQIIFVNMDSSLPTLSAMCMSILNCIHLQEFCVQCYQ